MHWIALPVALIIAVVAAIALLTELPSGEAARSPSRAAPPKVAARGSSDSHPHAEVRDESRQQLLEILREADEPEAGTR